MRRSTFLLTGICYEKRIERSSFGIFLQRLLKFLICFSTFCAFRPIASFAQQAVPGFRANGEIVNPGDTINVCVGSSIFYESTSTGNSAVKWIFKNGTPSTSSTNATTVNYNNVGIDSTIQTVSLNNDTASSFVIIKVNAEKPVPSFVFSPDNECGNVPVVFNSDASTGSGLTHKWSFGDGESSNANNPSHQFLRAIGISGTQNFQVKLVTKNSQNCSDSITKTVVVKKIPDASLGNPDVPNVDTINYLGVTTFRRCVNTPGYLFSFRNASTTTSINTKYTINWGDGSADSTFTSWPSGSNIAHGYTIGQHQMTVTIEGSTGCVGIKKYNIFLGTNPAGGFASPGNTNICGENVLNFILSGYQNNTPGTSYTIVTNDGTPSISFTHPPPDTISHLFVTGSCGYRSSNGFQTYNNAFSSTLIIQNPCDATSVGVIPIYVSGKPKASIAITPSTNICTNYQVYIGNNSIAGGTITTTGGGNSTCSFANKQVWAISPATGYNITYGSLGSLNGSANNTLSWTSGSSYLYVNFTAPGVYTIKMYVGNDRCGFDSTTRTICVRKPPQASFTMSKKLSCGIDTAVITNTSPVGGCLGDNYQWDVEYSDPQNCGNTSAAAFINGTNSTSLHPVIRFASAGRYIVKLTVTAIGTSSTCSAGIYRDTFWVKAKPKSVINPINTVCIGNPITPVAVVSNCYGESPVTYDWKFDNGTPATSNQAAPGNILYNATGTFPVILHASNECGTDRDTILAVITAAPQANAGADKVVCSNIPVQIGAASSGGLTYRWTPAAGLSNADIANPTATLSYSGPANDTTYTFVVKASAGINCTGTDTVKITVRKNPVVSVTPVATTVCLGSTAQLTAMGAASYSWTPTAGLNSATGVVVDATPASTTTYIVTGTLANGCSSSSAATVSVIAYPAVSAGKDSSVCNNSTSIQLSGSPSGGSWTGSSITPSGIFNPSAAGNGVYTVYYTATNGSCSKTDSANITVIDAPKVAAGNDTVVCQSTTPFQLSGLPVNGRWSGSNFIAATGQFTPSTPGTYSLIYTFGGGSCISSDTVTINVSGGIVNNTISSNQSICTATQPGIITGETASGGNTPPTYQWQFSVDNSTWNIIPGAIDKDYAPPVLTQTTRYRRIASTALCLGSEANASAPVTITVNPDASADFNPAATKGCTPFVITPATINVTSSNNIGEYRWHVNGSYLGSGQNFPGYTMNNAGDSITIKLVTISAFGCKNDSLEHGFTTIEKPVPAFSLSQVDGCGPINVLITNTTPNAAAYRYQWNFGQGQTSTLTQPGNITFPINPNYGDTVYVVSMKTFSACDTIVVTQTVTVRAQPKVLFTPDKTEGCSPMRVTFTNTSRGSNANYVWDFNDGSAPVATNATSMQHTFTTGVVDTFYVKLKGTNDCSSDSMIYAVVVNPNSIRIDFAVNGNERFGCAPHTVRFVNNTSGANNFTWNFGDGNTLNTTKGIDTVVHTFNSAGDYNITLLAANSCNDTTDTEPIAVQVKPAVSFAASTLVSCVTDTIRFTNASDAGISNVWSFGDGTTSGNREPIKIYNVPGNYRVWLTGSRVFPQGLSCSDSVYADIVIRDTLQGGFTVSDSAGICTPFLVSFTNNNVPSIQTTWNFGDGTTTTGDNVSHTFTSPGLYNVVMLSRGSSGCIYKAVKTIRVTAPVGILVYDPGFVCSTNSVRFEVRATDAAQYRFVFGDGDSVTATEPIVFHQYLKPGSYVPHAYMIAGSCLIKVSTGDTIKVDRISAGFRTTQQLNCGSTSMQFTDTSNAYFGVREWQWNFGDGTTSSLRNPAKTFLQNGSYNISLSVISASGCTDTLVVPVSIAVRNFPVSSIGSDSVGCTGQRVSMAALILSDDSVSNVSWNFGNNLTASGVNVNPVYNTSGIYQVRLITTTIYGCADTVYKTVRINAAPAVNAGGDVTICKGQSVQLQAFGANQWQWSPLQALSCTTCSNPVAKPSVSTLYVVKGTNGLGCSVSDSVLVDVVQPLNLIISRNDSICIGEQTQLFVSGATQYIWSPATGLSSPSAPNPTAQPTVTTQYQVIGRDAFNCFVDTATVTVAVGNYPTVDVGTGGVVAAGTPVPMNPILTNGPFKRYTWTPIIDLSCTNCPTPVATIKTNITYKLEVENSFGCRTSDTISYTVTCEEASQLYIPNAFSPDGDGKNDLLMVRGKGLASVKYFRVFNRWGQLVFERNNVAANDAKQGWDGKVNGMPANPDVYVYTVEVVCTAGANFVKKGNVTLFR